jgi:hypothetical protein
MYGTNLIYRNSQGSPNGIVFAKEEEDFECVRGVTVNGLPADYVLQGGYLQVEATVPPNEMAEVRIVYSGSRNLPVSEDGISYRAKAVVRRYLSEFRDNYLSRNAHLHQGAVRIKEALRL